MPSTTAGNSIPQWVQSLIDLYPFGPRLYQSGSLILAQSNAIHAAHVDGDAYCDVGRANKKTMAATANRERTGAARECSNDFGNILYRFSSRDAAW